MRMRFRFLLVVVLTTLFGNAQAQEWKPAPDFSYKAYASAVMGFESNFDYTAINEITGIAAGAYQFLPSPLIDLGYVAPVSGNSTWSQVAWTSKSQSYGISSLSDFVRGDQKSIDFQDLVFRDYIRLNWGYLSSTTKSKVGQSVGGVEITAGGLLNVSHFIGAGGANNWVSNGFDASNLDNLSSILRQNNMSNVEKLNVYLLKRLDAGRKAHGDQGTDVAISLGCLEVPFMSTSGERVTSPFGAMRNLSNSPGYHQGLDMVNSAGKGDPILAGVAGRVIISQAGNGGNKVIVESEDGTRRFGYFHLDRRNVSVGDEVEANTVIGTMGATGASAVHLHMIAVVHGDVVRAGGNTDGRVWKTSSGWKSDGKHEEPLTSAQIETALPKDWFMVTPEPFFEHRIPWLSNPDTVAKYESQGIIREDGLTLPNECGVLTGFYDSSSAYSTNGGVSMSDGLEGQLGSYSVQEAMAATHQETKEAVIQSTLAARGDLEGNTDKSGSQNYTTASWATLLATMQ